MMDYEKWMWTDLIGFDNRQPDMGVKHFLSNAGFIPDAVSILIADPDFINSYRAGEHNRVFPESYCSYGAHPRNAERKRQRWTKQQLKTLITSLRKKSIKVFCCVFGMSLWEDADALAYLKLKRRRAWTDSHPELFSIQYSGERSCHVCAYKRLNDGSYYEDFFVQQVAGVMREYGFDGFHGGDGFAPPRFAIYTGDFSDDMFEQFIQSENIAVPPDIQVKCGASPELISRRAAWIWGNKRKEWIEFHTRRSGRFWEKITATLHEMKKEIVLNSTWTRDPFESKYRFGIDYKILADIGVDAFIIEAPAGAMELAKEKHPRTIYDFMAMVMLIKACVPETRLVLMNAFNDTNEQFSVLRHAPPLLETEIYSFTNIFWYEGPTAKRCLSGILGCLAAGITGVEWEWIKKRWDSGFATDPEDVSGATLIVSGNLFAGEISNYLKTGKWSVHKILYNLIARGAQVYEIADVSNIKRVKGPVLVINPHLLTSEEFEKVLAYRGGRIILVGSEPVDTGAFPPGIPVTRDGWFCGVYRPGRKQGKSTWKFTHRPAENKDRNTDVSAVNEHAISWQDDLPGEKVPDELLNQCAQEIRSASDAADILSDSGDVNIMMVIVKKGLRRVFLLNNRDTYVQPKIDVGAEIKSIRAVTDLPLMPVHWAKKSDFRHGDDFYKGSFFKVIVPPKGITVLDIAVETPET